MNLEQFKNWSLAEKSLATPIGTYLGECVSLIQQYLLKVYLIPFKARGNAMDWATNADVLQYFKIVSDLQPGDILVYDLNDGVGHIEIYLGNGLSLQQNRRLDGKVHVDPLFTKYPYKILRRKGNDMTIAQAKDLALYIRLLAGNTEKKAYENVDYDAKQIAANPEYAAGLAKALYKGEWQEFAYRAGHYEEDIKKLKEQVANGDGEAEKKLQAIKDALK